MTLARTTDPKRATRRPPRKPAAAPDLITALPVPSSVDATIPVSVSARRVSLAFVNITTGLAQHGIVRVGQCLRRTAKEAETLHWRYQSPPSADHRQVSGDSAPAATSMGFARKVQISWLTLESHKTSNIISPVQEPRDRAPGWEASPYLECGSMRPQIAPSMRCGQCCSLLSSRSRLRLSYAERGIPFLSSSFGFTRLWRVCCSGPCERSRALPVLSLTTCGVAFAEMPIRARRTDPDHTGGGNRCSDDYPAKRYVPPPKLLRSTDA